MDFYLYISIFPLIVPLCFSVLMSFFVLVSLHVYVCIS